MITHCGQKAGMGVTMHAMLMRAQAPVLGKLRQLHNPLVLLQAYAMHFADANGRPYMSSGGRIPKGAPVLVGCTEEIEELRPKSPPPGGDRN